MNRTVRRTIVMTSVVLALNSASSWSGGPPNNDVSDDFRNTAGGTIVDIVESGREPDHGL